MNHILISIFVLSFTVAFAATFVTYLFYIKHKNRVLKYCLYYNMILFSHVCIVLLRQYVWNIQPENPSSVLIFVESLFYVWFFFIFYYFPRFIYSIIEYPVSSVKLILLRSISLIPLFLLPLPFIFGSTPQQTYTLIHAGIIYVLNTILGSMILYLFILVSLHYKKILNPTPKKIVKNILIITAIFLPGVAYDLFIRGKFGPDLVINGSFFCAIFIFAWNIMALFFNFKFYTIKIELTVHKEQNIPEAFFQKNQITSREKEIIGYILDEKTSPQISAELFISPRTVDKHIENIYKKMGINNKNELISHLKKMTSF